jgi:drug/metabolite transporter (DMT)-like permease
MKKPVPKAPLGASLIILSSLFYASYGIWTTLMGNFFGGYTASAARSVVVLVFLLPIIFVSRQWGALRLRQNWKQLAGMVFVSFFIWGPLYFAILQAGIGITSIINYASIVIGMFFFGWLWSNERFTKDKLWSALLGLLGLSLVFSIGGTHITWLALSAAALSGVCIAANTVLARNTTYNAAQSTAMLWITSVIANLVMAVLFRESMPLFGLHIEWLYLVIFSAASIVASWSLIRGLKLIEAGAAGIIGLLEIVFGILFGAVFFHERPSVLALAGAALIIIAALIPYLRNINIEHKTPV